jgi:hypothetical protein
MILKIFSPKVSPNQIAFCFQNDASWSTTTDSKICFQEQNANFFHRKLVSTNRRLYFVNGTSTHVCIYTHMYVHLNNKNPRRPGITFFFTAGKGLMFTKMFKMYNFTKLTI